MKKIIKIFSLVVISTIFIVGCSSTNNSDSLHLANCPDNMMGMGKKYFVNNLEKGNYEVEFTAKEYEYGTLKEEHTLYKSTIEHNGKNDTLKIGVIDGNEENSSYLKAIINDIKSTGYNLDFLKEGYDKGISISILNQNKYFGLDNEVAIAVYSISGENSSTEDLNIDEEFEIGNNLKDLVVYINLHKINEDKSTYIETDLTDKVKIGQLLFEKHLRNTYENFQNDEGKIVNILKDYKIIDANLEESDSEDTFKVAINYEIQSIDGYSTVFITGNGVEYKDNWVKDKYNIIEIEKVDDNKYKIIEIYTG